MKKLTAITLSLIAISAMAVEPNTPAYRDGRGYPNGIPDSFSRNQPRYSQAHWLHEADGWLPATFATVPEGEHITSQTWMLTDGVMVQSITTEPIPVVIPDITPLQLVLGLLSVGITEAQVEALINAIPDETERAVALATWDKASTIERDHQLIVSMGAQFGFTDTQLDDLFIAAKELE